MSIYEITNKDELNQVITQAQSIATVIYVSNDAMPVSRRFAASCEEVVVAEQDSGIRFCKMEYGSATSNLLKFAPNQLPVVTLMSNGTWCQTVMGADSTALIQAIEKLKSTTKFAAEHDGELHNSRALESALATNDASIATR